MFDTQEAMVRIDMSEYMEKHAVSRLVGAPPGYVGYDEGGQLTEAVRRRPYAVVLLDEIEKAHPDVFNTLLQVMDDGRLTDGQGRTVAFKNTVLIMTSNIPGGRAGVEASFKPEFVNRLDDIVEFDPLSRDADRRDRRPPGGAGRRPGRASAEIELELTDDARTLLGNLGYDPTYGARPLKRVIQKRLVDPLALAILEGRFTAGDHVLVDAVEGELTLSARRSPPSSREGSAGRVSGCVTRTLVASADILARDPNPPPARPRDPVQVGCRPDRLDRCHEKGDVEMPTYVMLTTLTPEGVQTIKNNPARIREVNREVEQLGATVKAQWATLGRFDFVNVIEAPDEQTIARVSLELGSRGTGRYETLSAIPIDDFISSI